MFQVCFCCIWRTFNHSNFIPAFPLSLGGKTTLSPMAAHCKFFQTLYSVKYIEHVLCALNCMRVDLITSTTYDRTE